MNKQILAGTVKAIDTQDPNGAFEVVLSAPTLDRDGEVIDVRAFEPLPDHITFDVDHGMSVTTTVGSGVPAYEGDLLVVRGTYASTVLGQEVRTLVNEGHIRSTSVAFMNAKREVKDGVPHIVKAELLNGAFVCIPSNRDALVAASKSVGRVPGLKALEGSYEQRREDIQNAVRAANPEAWWVYVVATYDDAVVYELDAPDGTTRWRVPYTLTDDGLSLGSAEQVEIVETVEPVKDTVATDTKSSTATTPELAAADAAAAPAEVNVGTQALIATTRANAALLLTT